jgi:1-acyl-sn-glycerol-3-phosphate acyltransferase
MKVSTLLFLRFGIALLIFSILTAPFIILPRKFHFKFLYPFFNFLFLFAAKVNPHNLSNNVLKFKEPVIFTGNHKSFCDFCIMTKYIKMPFSILINGKLFKNIFFRFIANKMLLIPVDQNNMYVKVSALEKSINLITDKKYSIILFPEGDYHFDKILGNLYNGVAKIARETRIKVIPIAIYGLNDSLIYDNKYTWKDVYIKTGDPMYYKDYNDNKFFIEELSTRIKSLYHEIESEIKQTEKTMNKKEQFNISLNT